MKTTEEYNKRLQEVFMREIGGRRLFGLTAADSGKSFSEVFSANGVIAVLLYAVAVVLANRDRLFDAWKKDVQRLYESSRYGTWAWWIETAKRWQKGDSTEVIDGEVGYSVVDESKRVVTAAMVRQMQRTLYLFVAKGDAGSYEKLDEEEVVAFQAYVNNVKPLGVNVIARSLDADEIGISGSVIYNGELTQDEIDSALKSAVQNLVSSLEYGATLYVSQVIDTMMDVEGVVDVAIEVTANGRIVDRSIALDAGYGEVARFEFNYERNSNVGRW